MSAMPPESAPAASPAADTLVLPGRVCGPGAGWTWIAQGWSLFARAAVMWIVALLLLVIIVFALSVFIPFFGQIIVQLLAGVFGAGLMLACAAIESTGSFELGEIFGGFRRRFGALLAVGVAFFVGQALIFAAFIAVAGFGTVAAIFDAMLAGDAEAASRVLFASLRSFALGGLVAAALYVPLLAAVWLAPALIALHGVGALAAMRASFSACLRNMLPFLVYGILMTIFAIVASIPIFLGFLVWFPLAITSTYATYRGIFTVDEAALPA